MSLDEPALLLLLVGTALLTLMGRSWIGRGWRARRARRRARRALAGEQRAVPLLQRSGFRVTGTQVPGSMVLEVDGRSHRVPLRADLIVTRRGKRYVAEVKTGKHAPQPQHRATRRQLLEYRTAYGADGVLLVDMERGSVHEVRFPALQGPAPHARAHVLWALVTGLALGAGVVSWLRP